MEKRAIIAFVLSFLVFMIWAQLYAPRRDVTVENTEIDGQQDSTGLPVENQPLISTVEKTTEEKPTVIEGLEEKEISVETPLYVAVLSNKGPSIKSFKLKNYRETLDPESPPIELFSGEEFSVSNALIELTGCHIEIIFSSCSSNMIFLWGKGRTDRIVSLVFSRVSRKLSFKA